MTDDGKDSCGGCSPTKNTRPLSKVGLTSEHVSAKSIQICEFGIEDYQHIWKKMQSFTQSRTDNTNDEMWLLQHFPVYTQGLAGKPEHLLNKTSIPVVQTDRGGQITYHGPGQLVAYCLLNLKKRQLNIKTLVYKLEEVLIRVLHEFKIKGERHAGAPGIFVGDKKIASLGLRIKNGCCYHGIALNIDMDLTPFDNINPCGFEKLRMTQIKDYQKDVTLKTVLPIWIKHFLRQFED